MLKIKLIIYLLIIATGYFILCKAVELLNDRVDLITNIGDNKR